MVNQTRRYYLRIDKKTRTEIKNLVLSWVDDTGERDLEWNHALDRLGNKGYDRKTSVHVIANISREDLLFEPARDILRKI